MPPASAARRPTFGSGTQRPGRRRRMRRGACVVRYQGKRGVTWRIKWADADGRQVQETLGSETDGWNERKAKAELENRLTDVRRESLRRAKPVTFETFARRWLETYPDSKGLKRSTREGYETILERHLIPALGTRKLDTINVADLDAYV